MYGQSCRVVWRGGPGPLQFGGASPCSGCSVTFHNHRSVGISQVNWVHLARQYIALRIFRVAAADREPRFRGPALPRAPDVGVVRLVLPGVCVGAQVVRGGA